MTCEAMDTGRLLLRQLRAAHSFAESDKQREQVEWWQAKIAELRKQQPSAEHVDTQLEFRATPVSQSTGTEGGGS